MKLNVLSTNQNEVHLNNGTIVFFSYNTPVAARRRTQDEQGNYHYEYIRTDKKWSVTTSRHINQWLDGVKAEVVSQSELDSLV